MITPREVTSKYGSLEPYLRPLRDIIRGSLQTYCDEHNFALVSRIKTLDSLSEKIESGRYSKWSEIDDLVGFAIIIPTLTEEHPVLQFLQSIFQEGHTRKRGTTQKAPDVFRFDLTRFVGTVKPPPLAGDRLLDVFHQTPFEIQIRSAFEHAWAVTTHALTFKTKEVDWKRLRLAAQLKAAVEQLDTLILSFEDTSLKLQESEWPDIQAKKRIIEFVVAEADAGRLPAELLPKDFNRFSENVLNAFKASTTSRGKGAEELADSIESVVKREIKELGSDNIPRSISICQFAFACLCKSKLIAPPLRRYVPLITTELETLYPVTREFQPRFNFAE